MGLASKLASFARSPQGRRLTQQAKAYAAKPENRRRIEQLAARVSKGGRGTPPR